MAAKWFNSLDTNSMAAPKHPRGDNYETMEWLTRFKKRWHTFETKNATGTDTRMGSQFKIRRILGRQNDTSRILLRMKCHKLFNIITESNFWQFLRDFRDSRYFRPFPSTSFENAINNILALYNSRKLGLNTKWT